MFQVESLSDVVDKLNEGCFDFTDDSYLNLVEISYKERILGQRSLLVDSKKQVEFIKNFRHPSSPSIIKDIQTFKGYPRPRKNNPKEFALYLAVKLAFFHPYFWAEKDFVDWNFNRYKFFEDLNGSNPSIPLVGNPPRQVNDGLLWNMRWIRYLYLQGRIKSVLQSKYASIKNVIDLGGCYGGFLGLMAKDRSDMSLTLVEFAENLPLAAYYLAKTLPGYTINIVNKKDNKVCQAPGNVYLVPAHCSAKALDNSYDLFCNHVSLGEMSRNHFDDYVNSTAYKFSRFRQIVNRFSSNPNPLPHKNGKGKSFSWSNNQTFVDYKLDDILYFDVFPYYHFFPLQETGRMTQKFVSTKSFSALLPLWKRSPVTSQCFEVITEKI